MSTNLEKEKIWNGRDTVEFGNLWLLLCFNLSQRATSVYNLHLSKNNNLKISAETCSCRSNKTKLETLKVHYFKEMPEAKGVLARELHSRAQKCFQHCYLAF
jgi:hypothetical protein